MNPDTTLQALVERYLDERHRLGFSARTQAYALRSFARHVHAVVKVLLVYAHPLEGSFGSQVRDRALAGLRSMMLFSPRPMKRLK